MLTTYSVLLDYYAYHLLSLLLTQQIKRHQLTEDAFWTKTGEESFESIEFFQDLEKTFGTGRARNVDIEGSVPKAKMPKIKELKVLDAKSAQNICEYSSLPSPNSLHTQVIIFFV